MVRIPVREIEIWLKQGYRCLTIKEVREWDDSISFTLHDSMVGFQMDKAFLRDQFGMTAADFEKDARILVRGRIGNEDCQLNAMNAFAALHRCE